MASHPLIHLALSGLDLDLEQELQRHKDIHQNNEAEANDSRIILENNPILESKLISEAEELNSADLDVWDFNYTETEDLAGDLDAEFSDQLSANELLETSSVADHRKRTETEPNIFSPLGLVAMIFLLIVSAAIGYFLVDPSGLKRFIKQDSKPVSLLNLQLKNENIL